MPTLLPSSIKSIAYLSACSTPLIFVPSPMGRSITRKFVLVAIFFAITEQRARLWGSSANGYSTFMNKSSAGARLTPPPQHIIPFVWLTISTIFSALNVTGARTSMVSAVPEAEVMALDDVFGMVRPAAATIGTIKRVTLFPGTPPILCLS